MWREKGKADKEMEEQVKITMGMYTTQPQASKFKAQQRQICNRGAFNHFLKEKHWIC